MAKPTIVIVPGSFSPQGGYQNIVNKLRSQGYPALAISLPSTQKRYPLPPATMQDDATHIRAVAETLIAQGKEAVFVCHSYGGMPTSEGLVGLGKQEGKQGGVKRIVYLTAVVPRVGQNQVKTMDIPVGLVESAVDGYMHMDPVQMAGAVVNDMSWEEAYECAVQLPHHSAESFLGALTQAAYENIPTSYILCEKDLIISPEAQNKFISVLEEVSGKKVHVLRLDSGHCPNWSQPDRLVEFISQAADQ